MLATGSDTTVRDGPRAVLLARRACELSRWKQWHFVDTLAAACAETGDFDQAIQRQHQAPSLEGVTAEDRKNMQRRLDRYTQHQPAVETP